MSARDLLWLTAFVALTVASSGLAASIMQHGFLNRAL